MSITNKVDTQELPIINPTSTSGDKYYYFLNNLTHDTYKAKRNVPNPEGYGIIKVGSEIADVTYSLGFFKRLYARMMGYIAWQFTVSDDSRPADYYYIKRHLLYCKADYFELTGESWLPQRTKFQCRVSRIKEWFNKKFHRSEI